MSRPRLGILLVLLLVTASCDSPSAQSGSSLTVYSGRAQQLVGPILERFERESGIDVEVRYAGTPELANAILEEGDNSPADVFFAQDAGSLGPRREGPAEPPGRPVPRPGAGALPIR